MGGHLRLHSLPYRSPTIAESIPLHTLFSRAQEQLNLLKAAEFIDRATRAVFVEFTVYNANSDIFVVVRLCLETTSSGTVRTAIKTRVICVS